MSTRKLSSESAARQIIKMIGDGKATDADDAVSQDARLAAGREFMKEAVSSHPASSSSRRTGTPVPAATGSGPALLSR